MQENKSNDFFVDLALDVALRYVIHDEADKQVRTLYMQAAKSINWQSVMNSENAADEVLNRMEVVGNAASMLINLTSQFIFRAGLSTIQKRQWLGNELALCMTWPRNAAEFGVAQAALTATSEKASSTFINCPWMMFLYLLSMSNVIDTLDAKYAPKSAAPKPA